jgi:hypothetical protein
MDDEVNRLHRLVADASAEFNRAVVNAFEALYARKSQAEVRGLVERCYSTAGEYEAHLNTLLAAMNREPAKYAEEIIRIYGHKVLKKQTLDSLPINAHSGSS